MRLVKKTVIQWGLGLFVVVLAGVVGTRTFLARQATQKALEAQTTAKNQSVAELAATDVVKAQMVEISQGVAVSGALRAVNSAVVKARVPGELQGLLVREGDVVKAGQVLGRVEAIGPRP